MLLNINYQQSSASNRKEIIIDIKKALVNLDSNKYPNIKKTIESGNTKIHSLINLIINQMYVLDFNIKDSLLAVEENI